MGCGFDLHGNAKNAAFRRFANLSLRHQRPTKKAMPVPRGFPLFSLRIIAPLLLHAASGFVISPMTHSMTNPGASSSSSCLAASTASVSVTERVAESGINEGGGVLTPQGKHHAWYSLTPLTEASQWNASPGAYFKSLSEANGGAPIFKAHPGLACIALTDHASGEWFFNQPESVLDRQVGGPCVRVDP